METLQAIWETIRPHLSSIALALTWIVIAATYWRKRSHWRQKRFSGHVNFSLNYVADGKLQLRTLLETSASEVWLNDHGVRLVMAASDRTRPDQPFIILDDPPDMAFIKRAALNVLSEKFANVFLAASVGVPVKTASYYFAITFENFKDMRTRKFRVLIVESQALVSMFGPDAPDPTLLESVHADRLQVLRTMARLAADPAADRHQVLGRVQLGIAC